MSYSLPQGPQPPIPSHWARQGPPPPSPGRGWIWKLVLLVGGGVFLSCVGLCLVSYVLYVRESEEPVNETDKSLVITAEDLAERTEDLEVYPKLAKFTKTRTLDGCQELVYEYESPDQAESTLYVKYSFTIEPSVSDARLTYHAEATGFDLGLGLFSESEIVLEKRNELWRYGDESDCVLLTKNGKPIGNLFSGRRGRKYFSLVIIGVYFDAAEPIADLLDPMLRKLEAYPE